MNIVETAIPDLLIIEPRVFGDDRGFFMETWNESAFREDVVDQFADEYLAGRTPVPCIRCNMGPKFTDLFRMARELGADCLATGHYVQRIEVSDEEGGGGPHLSRANAPARDQSYFLYATTQTQLDYFRFPLGGLPKSKVRELAEAAGLRNAAKPDSQDICFVPDGNYAKIVTKMRPEGAIPGPIVHAASGEVLGQHKGIIHFTVGQRKGLDIGGQPEPLYVIGLNAEERAVRVGPKRMLAVESADLIETNSIGAIPNEPLTAKVRSLAKPVPITLEGSLCEGASTRIRFETL